MGKPEGSLGQTLRVSFQTSNLCTATIKAMASQGLFAPFGVRVMEGMPCRHTAYQVESRLSNHVDEALRSTPFLTGKAQIPHAGSLKKLISFIARFRSPFSFNFPPAKALIAFNLPVKMSK